MLSALQGDPSAILSTAANAKTIVAAIRDLAATRLGFTPFYGPQPKPEDPTGAAPNDELPLDVAGTVAVNVAHHVVEAIVGSKAVLLSGADIAVTAEIEQEFEMASAAEATRET